MITLYTRPGCSACLATKRRLKKDNVVFTTVDVDEFPEAIDRLKERYPGFSELPVVELLYSDDSGEAWSGYQPDRLEGLASRVFLSRIEQ